VKIAFISQPWETINPGSITGSISLTTYHLARLLARSGEVIIYAPWDRKRKRQEVYEGVTYRRLRIAPDFWFVRYFTRLKRRGDPRRPFFSSPLYYLGYALQIANDLRSQRCDVIHIHNFSQFIPIVRAFNPSSKIVLHMHCEWLAQLDHHMIERRLRQTNLIIGCSDYITGTITNAFPTLASRCQTVHNGADTGYFTPATGSNATRRDGRKRLLFVGRVSPEKGIHVLLDAMQKVITPYPELELEIIGPPAVAPREYIVALSDDSMTTNLAQLYRRTYHEQLRDKLSGLLTERVAFQGALPNTELLKHYQSADIFVYPSVWNEPSPLPPLEAMACGLPVIATRGGGLTEEIQDGQTGLLVERGNVDALALAITRLLADENLRGTMGARGRMRAIELFSWDRVAESLLRSYQALFT
jgi:glycosyltransferase involved in cell wall biosynthesis